MMPKETNKESNRDSRDSTREKDSQVESHLSPDSGGSGVSGGSGGSGGGGLDLSSTSPSPSMIPPKNLHSPNPNAGTRGNLSSQPGTDAESLQDMSVRGLDLLKYAHIASDGSYRCIQCEKVQIVQICTQNCRRIKLT